MRNPPPEVVASWPEPNYVNPTFQGPQLAIISITFLTLSVIVVSARMFVRVHMRRSSGWDDWTMVATMPLVICVTVSGIISTHYGWGYHIWDNKPEIGKGTRMTSWFNQLLFVLIMTLVKLSLLASYLRFFTKRTFVRLTWAMIVLVLCWGVTFLLTMFLACIPLSKYWDGPSANIGCTDESARVLAASITNFITDIAVLCLPIPTLWKLHLPVRERFVLITLMSLGLIACGASVVRTYYMYNVTDLTYDVTWEGYNIWVWNAIELNLAVICASIPVLRPFAQKYFPRLGIRISNHRSTYGTRAGEMNSGIYKQQTIHQTITHRDLDEDSSTEALTLEYPLATKQPLRRYEPPLGSPRWK